ncbi:MAG: alcohol dehydrogenase catalytic domain-containing protein [Deltaproteobacteria bacterium]|nr:alcohol dehydrogenase catalytic domain-containing protein [Deltaproteobacteria bacterium]
MMKVARIHGPNDVRLDEVSEPACGPDDAILEVAACGICGSDVGYAKIGGIQVRADAPFPIGHELAGVVAEIGKNVRGVKVGARVALHPGAAGFGLGNGGPGGGFTKRLLVRGAAQGKSFFPIPDSMSFEQAALAEPLGVGMHAVDQANVRPGDKVAVLGAGAIGLSAAFTMLDRGIEDVCVVDLSEARLEVARKLGVPHVVHSKSADLWEALGRIHGRQSFFGMDVVGTNVFIEATGSGALLEQVVARCAPASRVSVVALHRKPATIDFMIVLMKQMSLVGAMEYPERYETMLELIARRDLTPMITHRFASTISSRPSPSPRRRMPARR